jgi:hypothetical protein
MTTLTDRVEGILCKIVGEGQGHHVRGGSL